jgi:hypothetical protein
MLKLIGVSEHGLRVGQYRQCASCMNAACPSDDCREVRCAAQPGAKKDLPSRSAQ